MTYDIKFSHVMTALVGNYGTVAILAGDLKAQ